MKKEKLSNNRKEFIKGYPRYQPHTQVPEVVGATIRRAEMCSHLQLREWSGANSYSGPWRWTAYVEVIRAVEDRTLNAQNYREKSQNLER